MARSGGVTGIDPSSWQFRLLPLPKRFTRGTTTGFCGGHAVGRVEAARASSVGCWWPGGEPELLNLEGQAEVAAGHAGGDVIPGQWSNRASGALGAVVWRLQNGRLVGKDLHDRSYERTWATGAGDAVVVGVGSPPAQPGRHAPNVGLVWRDGAALVTVPGPGDVALFATDGTRLAGSIRGRATLWPSQTDAPLDLSPEGLPMSEVRALDSEVQIGVAWKGMRARAGLWRGSAASFHDLTPKGIQSGSAFGGTRGFQVGFVRAKDTTRDGSPGSDNRAALWEGAADRWFDLHALLPAERYNASVAWAIEIREDVVQICGDASRYEVTAPGTAHESHVVPVIHPALWTARLRLEERSGRSSPRLQNAKTKRRGDHGF